MRLQLGNDPGLQGSAFLGRSHWNRLGEEASRLSSLLEIAFERRQGDTKHAHNPAASFPLVDGTQDFFSQIL